MADCFPSDHSSTSTGYQQCNEVPGNDNNGINIMKDKLFEVLEGFRTFHTDEAGIAIIQTLFSAFILLGTLSYVDPVLLTTMYSVLPELVAFKSTLLNIRSLELVSVLHYLCYFDLLEGVLIVLSSREVDVNIRNGSMETPLVIVVKYSRNIRIAEVLIQHGALVHVMDDSGGSPIYYATLNKDEAMLDLLLKYQIEFKTNALHIACRDGIPSILLKLLTSGLFDVNALNENQDTALIIACRAKNHETISLLTKNTNVNIEHMNLNQETALTLSIGQAWYSSLVLSAYNKLVEAVKTNTSAEIKRLVSIGVSLTYGEESLLFLAIQHSSDEILLLLINLGAVVNVFDKNLFSPLMRACSLGKSSKVSILVGAGATLTLVDSEGNTALHIAATKGYFDTVRQFYNKCWSMRESTSSIMMQMLSMKNRRGLTPFECAVSNYHVQCADFLYSANSYIYQATMIADMAAKVYPFLIEDNPSSAMEVVMSDPRDSSTVPSSQTNSMATTTKSEPEVIAPSNKELIQRILKRTGEQQFYHAAKYGMLDVIKKLLKLDNSRQLVNTKTEDKSYVMVKNKMTEVITNETPLYVSCYYGHLEVVTVLLNHGADPNILARNGWSCLFVSAKKGYHDVVVALVIAGADVLMVNKNFMTALNIAAYGGFLSIVKLLRDKGADVKRGDKMDATPLHAAVQSGKKDVVEYLLDCGADINAKTKTGITPLYVASYSGHEDIVRLFLYYKPHPAYIPVDLNAVNGEGLSAVNVACFNGRLNILNMLIDVGASLKAGKKVTPLYAASQNGHLNVVKRLLNCEVDINETIANGNTSVHATAIENKVEILKFLIEKGAKVDQPNHDLATPLYMTCEKGNLETLCVLIQHGANVNTTNKHTVSPLNISAQNGHFKVVEKLIAEGALVDAQTKDGPTPLFIAAQNNHIEICSLLLKAGANTELKTKENETAVFVASYFGHVDILKLLIEYKADLNVLDRDDRSPLWWACKAGRVEVVRLLLAHKVDITMADKGGVTAAMIAAKPNRAAVEAANTSTAATTNQNHAAVCELLSNTAGQAHLCIACLENTRTCVFLPCKHLAYCKGCSVSMDRTKPVRECPLCRALVTETIEAFT